MSGTILTVFVLLMVGPAAQAASFDCAKAQSNVEKMICGDEALSRLDEEIAAIYKVIVQSETKGASIKKTQKQWLKERNSCNDASCIKTAYESRLLALKQARANSISRTVTGDVQRRKLGTSRYELLREEPYEPLSEICEEFTAMLNAFGPKEPLMRCEQKLHPAFPKFKPIELQPLPDKDNFRYFAAIDDLAIRDILRSGYMGPLRTKDGQRRLFEELERLGGYKYYLLTTDRFIKNKTVTMLVQERQGDCRIKHTSMESARRIAYEWDTKTQSVIKRLFSFQSIFTYEGESMQGNGLLTSYWNEAELAAPSGNSGSIWVTQSENSFGATSPICYIVYKGKQ